MRQYFHSVFPDSILSQGLDINCFELLTVVVALKLWSVQLKGKRVCVYCDNQTAVHVVNSGRTRNLFLSACLREICFLCGNSDMQVRAIHIDGDKNRLSDMLSRCHVDVGLLDQFLGQVGPGVQERCVFGELFHFSSDW